MSTREETVVHVHRDDIRSRMGMWLFLFSELFCSEVCFLCILFTGLCTSRILVLPQKK